MEFSLQRAIDHAQALLLSSGIHKLPSELRWNTLLAADLQVLNLIVIVSVGSEDFKLCLSYFYLGKITLNRQHKDWFKPVGYYQSDFV